jgi:thiamine biosynthesis lipoprotein
MNTMPDLEGGLGFEARAIPDLRRASHEAMHTVFEIFAVHAEATYVAQAAHAAFDLVDRLEADLSRFRATSDISRINCLAAGQHTSVSATTMECLVIARHLFDVTGGAFDIAIGTGLPSLELDAGRCVVHAARSGVQLDLGAIGKGYAVDLVAELLEEWDLTCALVNGGFSSVLALDPPPDRDGWPLTLSDPAVPSRVLARLAVRQTALAASGIRNTDHIRDPGSGAPVRSRRGAWIAVPRPEPVGAMAAEGAPRLAAAAVSDALTTAFMVLSPAAIASICAHSPGVRAWVLPAEASDPQADTPLEFGPGLERGPYTETQSGP